MARLFSLGVLAAIVGCAAPSPQSEAAPSVVPSLSSGALTLAVPGEFATIQEALTAAQPGDVVQVAHGVFEENLTVPAGVGVVGSGVGSTTVYGEAAVSGAGSGLSDLTLRGDLAGGEATVGVEATSGSMTLTRVLITDFAIGVRLTDSDAVLDAVQVRRANQDGLLVQGSGNLTLTNSIVSVNERHGLRVAAGATGAALVVNCLLWGNGWPSQGAALMAEGPGLELVNSIVTANRRGHDCGASCLSRHSIIWGNFADYAGSATAGPGNRSTDPGLVNLSEGDFTLTAGSPAIDAGSSEGAPAKDFFGTARPAGGGIDIGPYERPVDTTPQVLITEVLANPTSESTGEFIELFNPGSEPVSVAGWLIDDGDSTDALVGWAGGPAALPPGSFGVVLDPDFDPASASLVPAPDAVWLTVASTKTLGSGLSTGDPVRLWAGPVLVDSFSFPFDPGNGVSVEKDALEDGDTAGNWVSSPCGASPGAPNCTWAPAPPAQTAGIVITEVMANPLLEKSGEYIELFNDSDDAVDVAGWVLDDGDSQDTVTGWDGGGSVVLPGSYALILDPDYADNYPIPEAAHRLSIASSLTLGNGLSTNDPITLRDTTGALVSSFGHPSDAGNGISIERSDPAAADIAGSWAGSTCMAGNSPGQGDCETAVPNETPLTVALTEVMANALDEDTGEFIELFNFGSELVDLSGWTIDDGDKVEPLQAYTPGGAMLLQPGAFALVLDSEYDAGTYAIGPGVLRLRTPDSSIASGLATTDPITLRAADGAVVATFTTPFNPGNGISAERMGLTTDVWLASVCGASPGVLGCDVDPGPTTPSLTTPQVVITEVMSNPLNEGTGEFVELYNAGMSPVDLTTLSFQDASATDALVAWQNSAVVLQPGQLAVVVDSDYDQSYEIAGSPLMMTTADKHLGNGLATGESLTLWLGDMLLSSYSHPFNAGNGSSVERAFPTAPDAPEAWSKSSCAGGSPGAINCTNPASPGVGSVPDGVVCPFGSGDCAGGICTVDPVSKLALCGSACASGTCADTFACLATDDPAWPQVCRPIAEVVTPPTDAPSLLLTEVRLKPSAAELVEIYNPNALAVSLQDVYLADYPGYHQITSGSEPPNAADFRMRFPNGASIAPGEYVTISLESASHFVSAHGVLPDYDTWPSDPKAPSMVGQIGSSAGLGNGSEMLVLFRWDGSSPGVTDLDYVVWGTGTASMDKTGVSIGAFTYADETPGAAQSTAPVPSLGSISRCDLTETGQAFGGNGAAGEDHTSEPLATTWRVSQDPSPGGAGPGCEQACVATCSGQCGADGCGGSCGQCGESEYCEFDTCLPIATGLDVTAYNKGWGGFKLPDAIGTEATLKLFTESATFEAFFGIPAPSDVDLSTHHLLFYSAGSYPVGAGNSATVTEVVDNNSELFVFTTRTYPEEDCITLNLPVPVWNLYTVSKPVSGATALEQIHGEEDIWCVTEGAPNIGASCGATQVCGEDLLCAGLTNGFSGFCNPKWMWGTYYAQTPTAIPDTGQVTLPLIISAQASVEVDVILYVQITHPDPSKLTLTMLNPLNEEGDISQAVPIFDQEPTTGPNLTLHVPVKGFSGDEVANGEWALVVEDHGAGGGTVDVLWTEMTSRWD